MWVNNPRTGPGARGSVRARVQHNFVRLFNSVASGRDDMQNMQISSPYKNSCQRDLYRLCGRRRGWDARECEKAEELHEIPVDVEEEAQKERKERGDRGTRCVILLRKFQLVTLLVALDVVVVSLGTAVG